VIKNARSLFEEAMILHQHARYARAVTLAILAIEEIGKISIIKNIITADSTSDNYKKELKDWWRKFRSHRAKNSMWVLPLLLDSKAKKEHIEKFMSSTGNATAYLDEWKMASLYVDVITSGQVVVPTKLEKGFCDEIVEICALLVCQEQILTSPEALTLYKSHFPGGVANYPMEHLFKYYEIAEEKGFIEQGRAQDLRESGTTSLIE